MFRLIAFLITLPFKLIIWIFKGIVLLGKLIISGITGFFKLIFSLFKGIGALGKLIVNTIKYLFIGLFYAAKYILIGPQLLCTYITMKLGQLLHINVLISFALGILTPASLLYTIFIHIPYSIKEKIIKVPIHFKQYKEERQKVICSCFFYSLEAILLYKYRYLFGYDFSIAFLIAAGLYSIYSFGLAIYKITDWNKQYSKQYIRWGEWKKWTENESLSFEEETVENLVSENCHLIAQADSNKNKFYDFEMPFGRATAFISYFERDLSDEEPLYFTPKMSEKEEELREFGCLITNKGLYISANNGKDIELPFWGIWKISKSKTSLKVDYGLSCGFDKTEIIESSDVTFNLDALNQFLDKCNDLSYAYFSEKVTNTLQKEYEECVKNHNKNELLKDVTNAAASGALSAGLARNATVYSEVKNNFDGSKGHGTAAEYANTTVDKLLLKNAKALGADNAKWGADRHVNGISIQCKYCQTPASSINHGISEYVKSEKRTVPRLYINDDGSMMQIEVPREQYKEAVNYMQKKIDNGEVVFQADYIERIDENTIKIKYPHEENPRIEKITKDILIEEKDGQLVKKIAPGTKADEYVRKGHITYNMSLNIACSGTIESIAFDAASGVVCSLPGAGITAVLTFVCAVWNKEDPNVAAKKSLKAGAMVIGKGALIYTLTMQLSRGKMINPAFIFKKSTNRYIANPSSALARKITKAFNPKLKGAELAKQARKNISRTVTFAVVFGPDICRACQSKISGKQLIKNSTVNTAGLVGGAIGTSLGGPIGAMAGGALASFVAKKVLDKFVEDDAVTMYRIMREEFLDVVMMLGFNKEEFDEVIEHTLAREKMNVVLQSMYQSGEPRAFARAMMNEEVQKILAKREHISDKMIEDAMELALVS